MDHDLSLGTELLSEYRICQDKATANGDNVWKSAIVLGAGSAAGVLLLLSGDQSAIDSYPWLVTILALFAIGLLLAWHRFAERWRSIAQAMYRRMEHLERTSALRANLYIAHLDERIILSSTKPGSFSHPWLGSDMLDDLNSLNREHQARGIRPMTMFIVEMNIAVWVALIGYSIASSLAAARVPVASSVIGWIFAGVFVVVYFCRLWLRWGEK